jgi:hypothetical protein
VSGLGLTVAALARVLLLADPASVPVAPDPPPATQRADAVDVLPLPALAVEGGDAIGFGPSEFSSARANDVDKPCVEPALSLDGYVSSEAVLLVRAEPPQLRVARFTAEPAVKWSHANFTLVGGVRAEADLATTWSERTLPGSERAVYGSFARPWELYGAWASHGFSASVGRQIVALGHARAFPLLDVVNPRDVRVPLLGGEPRRVPVALVRLGYARGEHGLDLFGVFEADYRYRPSPLGTYSALPGILARADSPLLDGALATLRSDDVRYQQRGQGLGPSAVQVLARYRYSAGVGTFGLYAGQLVHAEGVLRWAELAEPRSGAYALPVSHLRYGLLGASFESAVGAFVPYVELSAELDRPVNVGVLAGAAPRIGVARQTWERATVGVRYEGLESATTTLELSAGQRLADAPGRREDPALVPVAPLSVALAHRHALWRDRLELDARLAVLGPRFEGGVLARAELSARPRDALSVRLAYAAFFPGDAPSALSGLRTRGGLMLGARWDFDAR